MLKRVIGALAATYVGLALIGRLAERFGAVTCECSANCWCRLPFVSTVRWVMPFGHR